MMADFNLAILVVLQNEGGYVFDPKDPGGETNFGISKLAYPSLDIKNLTVDQAKEIYLRDFWLFGGIRIQEVATKIFDSYVNMKHRAIKIAQNSVGLSEDGIYGPRTEAAINSMSAAFFLGSFRAGLVQHYQDLVKANPNLEKFLDGWLRRAKQ